jgi:hypothetical protein
VTGEPTLTAPMAYIRFDVSEPMRATDCRNAEGVEVLVRAPASP